MSYAKQTWNSGASGGTPISASALNYMENGIEQAAGVVMTKAQRVALTGMTTGYRVYESDTGFKLYYDGTRFRYEGDRVAIATLAARDALTPYDGLTALVSSSTQTDGGEWLYFGGITAWIRLNVWSYLLYTTSYGTPIPVTGTPTQVPSANYNINAPLGRTVDVEFYVSRWGIGANSAAYVRMIGSPAQNVLDGAELVTASGNPGMAIPMRLAGQWVGTGIAYPCYVQYWCGQGSSDLSASSTSGSPVYMRYKIK